MPVPAATATTAITNSAVRSKVAPEVDLGSSSSSSVDVQTASNPPVQGPRVGVGIFVLNRNGEFLLGKRLGSHGHGTFALPGGHLEMHESFEDCARREALEETGVDIDRIEFLTAVNSPVIGEARQHYVTIFMFGQLVDERQQPTVVEPEKCEAWHWVSWDELLRIASAAGLGVGIGLGALTGEDHKETEHAADVAEGRAQLFAPLMDLLLTRPMLGKSNMTRVQSLIALHD